MTNQLARFAIAGAAFTAFAQPGWAAPVQIEGVVVTNAHGRLTIKTPSGDQSIVLPPGARVRAVSGAFGVNKGVVSHAALLPGLPVWVEGDDTAGHIVAREIEYKQKDYKTALQISAGSRKLPGARRSSATPIPRWANGMFALKETSISRRAALPFLRRTSRP